MALTEDCTQMTWYDTKSKSLVSITDLCKPLLRSIMLLLWRHLARQEWLPERLRWRARD